MHRSITALALLLAGLWLSLIALRAAEEQPQDPPAGLAEESPPRSPRFPEAVVRGIVYGLEENGEQLFLTSQPLTGKQRQVRRVALDFKIPSDSTFRELALAKLGNKNLMAVVKLKRGEEFEFHCLTMIGPGGNEHIRDRFAFHQARFYTTTEDLLILAIGGRHFQGSVFIVLGDMTYDVREHETGKELFSTTKGMLYFNGCPWPPIHGELSPFSVDSPPQRL